MSGSMNLAIIVGNLGRDPETRHMQDGTRIVHLSVATAESWKDRQSGERREKVEWHRVVVFNDNLGKIAEAYLKKGSKVALQGTIQTRKWTDRDGNEKYTTEIVLPRFGGSLTMLDRAERTDDSSENGDQSSVVYGVGRAENFPDDEIPF